MLFPPKIILIPLDIILTRIRSTLHFDDDKWIRVGIRKTMEVALRNIGRLVRFEDRELLSLTVAWIADIYRRDSGYDRPVLTPMLMRLERETLIRMDYELLHFIEWRILEDIVDSPWAIAYLEIV